ncbi:MAG: DUF106 domain-containing protein [Methanobacteriota archaeon]|nr:MAG: DUF106 domain-containing protein [Euryarchaeota archaeon]
MVLLDAILSPLLRFDPFTIVVILALTVAIISTAAYKLFTDQTLMKSLREKQKEHQRELKKHRDNPQKMMQIQKQAMDANMQYMMQSLKPMFFTFLPIILIFGWANAHLVYEPLQPGVPFTAGVVLDKGVSGFVKVDPPKGIDVDNSSKLIESEVVTFQFKGEQGEYLIPYTVMNRSYDQHIIIGGRYTYADPIQNVDDGVVKEFFVDQDKLIVLNLFGWKLGWLGSYIILVMIASILFKKIFRVH